MTDPPPGRQLRAELPALKGLHRARDGIVPAGTGEPPPLRRGGGRRPLTALVGCAERRVTLGEAGAPARDPVHSHDAQTTGQPSRGRGDGSGQTAGRLAPWKTPQGLALAGCAGGGANDRLHFHLPRGMGVSGPKSFDLKKIK